MNTLWTMSANEPVRSWERKFVNSVRTVSQLLNKIILYRQNLWRLIANLQWHKNKKLGRLTCRYLFNWALRYLTEKKNLYFWKDIISLLNLTYLHFTSYVFSITSDVLMVIMVYLTIHDFIKFQNKTKWKLPHGYK